MSGYALDSIGGFPSLSATDYQYLSQISNNTPNVNGLSFRGGESIMTSNAQAQPEQKNNIGKWILWGAIGIGTVVGLVALSKKGNGSIIEGAKSLIGKASDAAKTGATAASTATEAATTGKRAISTVNNNTFVTLPGEKNIINGSEANVRGISRWLGIEPPKTVLKGSNKLADGNQLSMFSSIQRTSDNKQVRVFAQYVNGEEVISLFGKGQDGKFNKLLDGGSGLSVEEADKLKGFAHRVFDGKVDINTLDHVLVRNTDKATGAIANFRIKRGSETLASVITDRFNLNDTKVLALEYNDSAFKKAIEEFKKNGGKNLKILKADVTPTGSHVTFTIDGERNVLAIIENVNGKPVVFDKVKDAEEFAARMTKYDAEVKSIKNTKVRDWVNKFFEAVA